MEHCAICISLNSLKQSYYIYVCEDLERDSDLDRVQKFEMLARSFWMTLKFVEYQLCINQKTVYQILSDCLGRSKFCPEFVLHSLRDEQKEPKVTDCEDFIQTTCWTSPVITVHISQVFSSIITKQNVSPWSGWRKHHWGPNVFACAEVDPNDDHFYWFHKEFLPGGKLWKANSGLLGRLLKWISHGRPQFW